MLGSIHVATIRGIPVRLHFTLLAVVGLLVFQLGHGFGLATGLGYGVVFGVALFGSILLHELGHSIVAQAFGIPISGIYLHIFGGMALMPELPRTPRQELLIAVAGPLVSLAIAVGLLFGLLAVPVAGVPHGVGALATFGMAPLAGFAPPSLARLAAWMMTVNFGMFLFNLVPALPMDGGRIFRALLATKLGSLPATRVAAWVSRAIAVAFIIFGLRAGVPSLPLIGILLFFMVAQEIRAAEVQDVLRRRAADPFPFGPGFRFAPSFQGWAPRRAHYDDGVVIDVGEPKRPRETREEFVDPYGRRFVVITRLAD